MGRWKNARRWGGRTVLSIVVVAVVAGSMGRAWERSEQDAFLEAAFEPPGQMILAGGHEFHVVVDGEGSPGVMLISGLGDDFRTWGEVRHRLADSTRVVSYDRPGLGWSPARNGSLSLDAAVEDLRILLASPGLFEEPPLLVGHSLGGVIARQFAYQHPSQVSGLVLLDAPPAEMPALAKAMSAIMYRLGEWSGSVGLSRRQFYRTHPDLTREQALRQAHLNADGSRSREIRREFLGVVNSEPFDPPPGGGLGSLPLTVFVATWDAPPFLQGMLEEMNAAKRLMGRESERGKVVEVSTGHYVHREDPDAVIAEVTAALDLIKSATPLGAGPETLR